MGLIKIDQAVIVEGKYDKIKLESIIDALIIETNGFGIFKDKEKVSLIKRLAERRGILILTDSDSAGFKIRSYIKGFVDQDLIINAYIPDVLGKEKRKASSSKEGKIGVEGISREILIETLDRAGVFNKSGSGRGREITNLDLYEFGISGRENSRERKRRLLEEFNLPERLSTNSLVKVLNSVTNYEEFRKTAKKLNDQVSK